MPDLAYKTLNRIKRTTTNQFLRSLTIEHILNNSSIKKSINTKENKEITYLKNEIKSLHKALGTEKLKSKELTKGHCTYRALNQCTQQ
jgi:pyruvate/2-oxoglutarate dehydrogenase complex dihydrolipoamide acyltransferase (E2) component